MKPSLRRDSLEKAARKVITPHVEAMGHGMGLSCSQDLVHAIARLLERHGAKVRRETLREAAEIACRCTGGEFGAPVCVCFISKQILSLTPRTGEREAKEMSDVTCEEDCDGRRVYTDGISWLCLCRARIMNSFVGAHFKKAKP